MCEMIQIGMGEYGNTSSTSWCCWHLSTWPLSCCLTLHGPIFLRIMNFCQLNSQVPLLQLMNTYATIQVLVVLYSFACKYWQNFHTKCSSICFVGKNNSSRHSHKHSSKCLLCVSPPILQLWESAFWMGYQVWGKSLSLMLKMSCFK